MAKNRIVYPISVSLSLIVVAVILSFVDLAFLNDVIGKVLDIGATESMAIAFALGLVGIAIMAHQGVKEAHGGEKVLAALGHYVLWISLGLTFVLIRLFSASILQLDNSLGDEPLLNIIGMNIREVDLVLAPLMLFLYLATGLMVKDGVKNLLLNPEYENWKKTRKENKEAKKLKEDIRRTKAENKIIKLQSEDEREQDRLKKEREEARRKKKIQDEETRINNIRNGTYSNALVQYRAKEKEIKEKYQKISANIDFVKSIDKQEKEFEAKVKPSLLKIVQESIHSVQNRIALAIRKKTGEDITNLRNAIELHNKNYRQQQESVHITNTNASKTIHTISSQDRTKPRTGRFIQ